MLSETAQEGKGPSGRVLSATGLSGRVLSATGLSGRVLSGRLQVGDDQGLQCEPMEAGLLDCTHRQRLEVDVLVHLHASKHNIRTT